MCEESGADRAAELLRQSAERLRMSRRHSAFRDFGETVRETGGYRVFRMVQRFFRRFRLFSAVIRVVEWLLLALQAGTLVLLTTAVFLVLLPAFGILAVCLFLIVLPKAFHDLRVFRSRFDGRRVFLLFSCPSGGFSEANARDLSEDPRRAVIVVSPFWLSPAGIGGRRIYLTARQVTPSLLVVRRYYFFLLRRRWLKNADTVWIY